MNCRAIHPPARPTPVSARERLETIDGLLEELLDAIERGAGNAELSIRALTAQNIACVGAAYERRRERDEA